MIPEVAELARWPVPDNLVAFCTKMRKLVPEDQGHVEPINHAVHAVAAALIHHTGLTNEFRAIVSGTRTVPPSDALLKAWKNAQKMRQFFMFGDVKSATDSHSLLEQTMSQQARHRDTQQRDESRAAAADDEGSGYRSKGSRIRRRKPSKKQQQQQQQHGVDEWRRCGRRLRYERGRGGKGYNCMW